MLMLCSTCFGHLYAHYQELKTIALVTCMHLTSNQQQLENQTAYMVTDAIVVSS